jgi:hypothetical protein
MVHGCAVEKLVRGCILKSFPNLFDLAEKPMKEEALRQKFDGTPKPTSKRNLPIFVVHNHVCLRGLTCQYVRNYHD